MGPGGPSRRGPGAFPGIRPVRSSKRDPGGRSPGMWRGEPSRMGLGGLSQRNPGRSLGVRPGHHVRWDLGGRFSWDDSRDQLGWGLEGPSSDWTLGIPSIEPGGSSWVGSGRSSSEMGPERGPHGVAEEESLRMDHGGSPRVGLGGSSRTGHGDHLGWDMEDSAGWGMGGPLGWDLGGSPGSRPWQLTPAPPLANNLSTAFPCISLHPSQEKSHRGLQHHPKPGAQPPPITPLTLLTVLLQLGPVFL